jgi:hypothetical protein
MQQPNLTLGYTRQELVWMPLLANDAKAAPAYDDNNVEKGLMLYEGKDGGTQSDTYSVLASFGSDMKAGGGGTGVAIAQYFATGLAARKLAEKGGASLVTVQPANVVAASVVATYAKTQTGDCIRKYWIPDGTNVNSENEANLEKWMSDNGVDASIPVFLYGGEFEKSRAKAVQDLGITCD